MTHFTISFKRLYIGLITLIIPLSLSAQINVKWTASLTSNIGWQEVTSLGNLIVSTDTELVGVDPETGDVRWRNPDYRGLSRQAYEELSNSPFFAVTLSSSINLIDQLSGDVVFSSSKAGIKSIDEYFFLYNSDAILVAGKDVGNDPLMVSAKMSDGSVSWKMNEKFGRMITATELGNKELLIVTLFNNYKLNATTGDIIWKVANSAEAAQADKMGALGALVKAAAENLARDMEIELRYYRPSGSDIFYLGSQQESQGMMTSSSGEASVIYSNVFNAYNISDGNLVWDKPLEVSGILSQVAFLDNGILVLPDDGNRTKINLYDYKTREGLWGKKGKGIAIKGGIYDYLNATDGMLLVSQTSNNNYLNYLDTKAGMITFEKPVKVDGKVMGIVHLSGGILYVTTETINILNQTDGTLKWSKSIETTPQLTSEHNGKIYAFDIKSKTLKAIDKASQSVSELSSTQLKFEGNEDPKELEVMSDGIFIHSDQNVAKFGFDGSLKFQKYYSAPREPAWKRALLYANSVRAAYIGAASYMMSGAMAAVKDDVRQEDAIAGEMVNQIGNAYGQLGDAASSYAKSAFKQANARFKATASGRDFIFVMSKQDKDIKLLKISKNTGEIEGSIDLGKDKEPVYAVDDVTGQVYYQTESGTVTSYQAK